MIEYLLLLLLLPPSLELFHQAWTAQKLVTRRGEWRDPTYSLPVYPTFGIIQFVVPIIQKQESFEFLIKNSRKRRMSIVRHRGVTDSKTKKQIRPAFSWRDRRGLARSWALDPYKPIADYTGACFGRRRGKKGPEASSYTSTAAINQCLPSVGKTMPCCLHN